MNTFALAEDKECGTPSGTATRCVIFVEVSLRSFFTAAEVELLVAGLRYTLLQATLFCLRGYFQIHNTLRQVPWRVAGSRGYEISSVILLLAMTTAMTGCSVQKFAINKLGDSLANGGTTFASDNDPEFVPRQSCLALSSLKAYLRRVPSIAACCSQRRADLRNTLTYTFSSLPKRSKPKT